MPWSDQAMGILHVYNINNQHFEVKQLDTHLIHVVSIVF